MQNMKLEYDKYGRMKYNPYFHKNNRKPWTEEELQYLTNWYDIIGAQEMSFALERTPSSIYTKYRQIKKSCANSPIKNKLV